MITVRRNYTYSAYSKYLSFVIEQYYYVSLQGPLNKHATWDWDAEDQKETKMTKEGSRTAKKVM